MPPLLTLFTAPKPFTNPHIDIIQRNALRSWQSLGEAVDVVFIGDEEGMAEAAADLNLRQIKQVRTNQNKTPLLSSIFDLGRSINQSPFLAYVNAESFCSPVYWQHCMSPLSSFKILDRQPAVGPGLRTTCL